VKKILPILLISLMFGSCQMFRTPQQRVNHIVNKFNLSIRDTIRFRDTIYTPTIKTDKSFVFKNTIDSIFITKDRLKIKIIKQYDTLRVQGECVADTIFIDKKFYVDKIKVQKVNWFDKVMQFLPFIAILLLLYLILRIYLKR